MITKRIMIEFANPTIRAIDHIQDIRKAAEYAGLNLFSRHDVQLQYPMPTSDGKSVVVDIKIPEAIEPTFSVGNHLRGMSNYLLTKGTKPYEKYVVGKRLLNYIEVSETTSVADGGVVSNPLEAVVSFSRLLQRSDEEAVVRIRRIMAILEENN